MTTSAVQHQDSRRVLDRVVLEPKYDIEDLLGIVNPDIRLPLDMMEVLLRIVDDSRIKFFKPQFGKGMITAWAHIHGKLEQVQRGLSLHLTNMIYRTSYWNRCEPEPCNIAK